jgi:hypothetical protein
MSVRLQSGLLECKHLAEGPNFNPHEKLPFTDVVSVLQNLHRGLHPLTQTNNTNDNLLGRRGLDALRYLGNALEITAPYQDITPLTNWDFLRTLVYAPTDPYLFAGTAYNVLRAHQEWSTLEDVGVRALNRVGAVHTSLFKGQTTYSIFGLDLARICMIMQEALVDVTRLPLEQRIYQRNKAARQR